MAEKSDHQALMDLADGVEDGRKSAAVAVTALRLAAGDIRSLRAEVETLRSWQRAVAAELGWCEALGEDIPPAGFMAAVARTHAESHRAALAKGEDDE